MDYTLDYKGKHFTQRINKKPVRVLACAQGTLISGFLHLTPEHRVKDELNDQEEFVAITDAEVRELQSGQVLYKSDVILLNKRHLIWVIPHDYDHESLHGDGDTPA